MHDHTNTSLIIIDTCINMGVNVAHLIVLCMGYMFIYRYKQSRNIGPFKEVHVYCSLPIYQSDINKVILKILINFFFYLN